MQQQLRNLCWSWTKHRFEKLSMTQDARQNGCLTVSGLDMFIGQAAQQFELFTGKEAPLDVIKQTMMERL